MEPAKCHGTVASYSSTGGISNPKTARPTKGSSSARFQANCTDLTCEYFNSKCGSVPVVGPTGRDLDGTCRRQRHQLVVVRYRTFGSARDCDSSRSSRSGRSTP